jgi:hypothetical protein
MYKPKYFKIQELVDKKTFESNPDWKLWLAFDERILMLMDYLREDLKSPITINNWSSGGVRQWSGLRPYGTPFYSQFSQHSFGRAVDFLVRGIEPRKVRNRLKELMENGELERLGIRSITVEETKKFRDTGKDPLTWVHLDIRNNNSGYNEFYI